MITPSTRALATALVLLACAAGAGCKRTKRETPPPAAAAKVVTLDDVVAEFRAKIEPKLANAAKLGANLPKPTVPDSLKPDHGPIHLLVGNTATFAKGIDAGGQVANATILPVEDLHGDMSTAAELKYNAGEDMLLDCGAILAKKPLPTSSFDPASDPTQTRRVLAQCAAFTYLLVVRTKTKTDPLVNQAAHSFQGGHIDGDVLMFELDTGKTLGGYHFTVKNSSTLQLDVSDPWSGLEKELREHMWTSIRDAFEKLAPGSTIEMAY